MIANFSWKNNELKAEEFKRDTARNQFHLKNENYLKKCPNLVLLFPLSAKIDLIRLTLDRWQPYVSNFRNLKARFSLPNFLLNKQREIIRLLIADDLVLLSSTEYGL